MEAFSTPPVRIRSIKHVVIHALEAFSPLERLAFLFALGLAAIAALVLVYRINAHFMVSVPVEGGRLSEGVVGTPRFVNPLLAASEADRDLTTLVYRGLMKTDAAGTLVPDLAESYTVSDDGLTYTFVLKDTKFDDGTAMTSDDVLFTIKSAQDATLKSAERVSWEGVLVKTPDEKTVTFTLRQPFAPFLASTTLGILPKHIWSSIPYEAWAYSDFNTKQVVGSGLYAITNVKENASGVPSYYELSAVREKGSETPRIETVRLYFYANEESLLAAYKSGAVDAVGGIDPTSAAKLAADGARIMTASLPRVFGLFFNQNQAKIFADSTVRKAIALAIDKDQVVSDVLGGYGTADTGPIPASSRLAGNRTESATTSGDSAAAKALLEKGGWKLGADGIYQKTVKKETQRLSFEISTNDTPELTKAVGLIIGDLKEAGIEATAKVYETGSLNQDIIRPRKFQALFFGEVVSSQSDLYAFWHSSQRSDPGLNISGYANAKADKLLETGLSTLDAAKEAATYAAFEKEIAADMPAVFVYSPSYIYAVRASLAGIALGHVATQEDRFGTIGDWYLATDKVWKIFAPKQD